VSDPPEPPHEASETHESSRRLVLSEDLPLTIFVGVATAVVFTLIDLGHEWTLLAVATAPLVADAIKHYVQRRGWTKRRFLFLTALLVFFDRVKGAFARPMRRTSRPRRLLGRAAPGIPPWSAVAVTAGISSALTVVLFAIPMLTSFFEGGRTDPPEGRPPAAPGTMLLDWREVANLEVGQLVFEVKRLVVRDRGWMIEASIENRTSVTYLVTRPHVRGGTKTGLLVGKATLVANRFEPALPRVFEPGRRWTGRFSGTRRLAQGQRVRVSFGVFFNGASRPAYFRWITDHAVSLRT
jgi:hypothetical protein